MLPTLRPGETPAPINTQLTPHMRTGLVRLLAGPLYRFGYGWDYAGAADGLVVCQSPLSTKTIESLKLRGHVDLLQVRLGGVKTTRAMLNRRGDWYARTLVSRQQPARAA